MAWFKRKIKNGRVKINNHWYTPRGDYDGRLDGMTYLFGTYDSPDYVYLHSRQDVKEDFPGSSCVDGKFPWAWWDRVLLTIEESESDFA